MEAGKYNVPGVPNITGETIGYTFGASSGYVHLPTGAYGDTGTGNEYGFMAISGEQHTGEYGTFDASRCSVVYGSSDSVMPASADIPIALYLGNPAQI